MKMWLKGIRNLGVRLALRENRNCSAHLFDRGISLRTNIRYFLKGLGHKTRLSLGSASSRLQAPAHNFSGLMPLKATANNRPAGIQPAKNTHPLKETIIRSSNEGQQRNSDHVEVRHLKRLPLKYALAELDRLLQDHPSHPVLQCFKAGCLMKSGRLSEAKALYKEIMKEHPHKVVARNGLAETLAREGRLAEAESFYRETIEKYPRDAVAHNGLANILVKQGRLSEAESLYKKTVQRHPRQVIARNGLADTLVKQGRLSEAESQYKETIEKQPKNVGARCGLANVLAKQGRPAESEAVIKNTLINHPHNASAYNQLANLLAKQGKLAEAEALYKENVEKHPNDVFAKNGLAETLVRQGKLVEARAIYASTLKDHPHDSVASYGLANILVKQGRLAEAETLYVACLKQHPNNAFVRNGLASTLTKQGKLAEALGLYVATSDKFPGNIIARFGLANVLARQGRLQEALSSVDKLVGPQGIVPYDIPALAMKITILLKMQRPFQECFSRLQIALGKQAYSTDCLRELRSGLEHLSIPEDIISELDNLIHYREQFNAREIEAITNQLLARCLTALKSQEEKKQPEAPTKEPLKPLTSGTQKTEQEASTPRPLAKDVLASISLLAANPRKKNFAHILNKTLGELTVLKTTEIGNIPKADLGRALTFLSSLPKTQKRISRQLNKDLLETAKAKLVSALKTT